MAFGQLLRLVPSRAQSRPWCQRTARIFTQDLWALGHRPGPGSPMLTGGLMSTPPTSVGGSPAGTHGLCLAARDRSVHGGWRPRAEKLAQSETSRGLQYLGPGHRRDRRSHAAPTELWILMLKFATPPRCTNHRRPGRPSNNGTVTNRADADERPEWDAAPDLADQRSANTSLFGALASARGMQERHRCCRSALTTPRRFLSAFPAASCRVAEPVTMADPPLKPFGPSGTRAAAPL